MIDYIQGIDDQDEVAEIYDFFDCLDKEGAAYLQSSWVETRKLYDRLFEIKLDSHRFYYVYLVGNMVYLLHACHKQKSRAERKDIGIGKKRIMELEARIKSLKG